MKWYEKELALQNLLQKLRDPTLLPLLFHLKSAETDDTLESLWITSEFIHQKPF